MKKKIHLYAKKYAPKFVDAAQAESSTSILHPLARILKRVTSQNLTTVKTDS